MKKLYILIFSFLCILGFSQNPLLLDRNWQAEKVVLNNITTNSPTDSDAVFINFNNILTSFGFSTKVCSSIYGPINYNTNNTSLVINSTNIQTNNCSGNTGIFETNYFLFFTKNAGSTNSFNYTISATNFGYQMIITNNSGDKTYFVYRFPKTELASGYWNLTSLQVAGINYPNPTTPYNNLVLNQSLRASLFNGSMGGVGYLDGNKFKITNLSTTLSVSDDPAIAQFDGLYHDAFLRNNLSVPETISYELNGNQLTLTNLRGYKAFYNKSSQAPASNIKTNKWTISKLTVNNQVYIPTLNDKKVSFGNDNFKAFYFNMLDASIVYENDATFNIYNSSVTYVDSFDPPVAEFEGNYLENFFGQRDPANLNFIIPKNPFTYTVSTDGKTLTIKNNKNDIAVYNKEVLATSETSKSKIPVYPNPATDIVIIENIKPGSTLELIDNSGKLVKLVSDNKLSKTEINIKNLTPGIYYLKVDGQSVQKIIKK